MERAFTKEFYILFGVYLGAIMCLCMCFHCQLSWLSTDNVVFVMNRDFIFNLGEDERPGVWTRAGATLNKWLWGALCCGIPGVPCYFCACCDRHEPVAERERTCVNQSTATADRMARPHRPHAPGGRKSTPELLSAVRCALTQLQGEPAPQRPIPPTLATAVAHNHSQVQPAG